LQYFRGRAKVKKAD